MGPSGKWTSAPRMRIGFCWVVEGRAFIALGEQRHLDLWVPGQPSLQNEFQDSRGYTQINAVSKKTEREKIGVLETGGCA